MLFSQSALLWFEVLPDILSVLPDFVLALEGAPGAVIGASSWFEGRQQCPPSVWYSLEIDWYKFALQIIPDTPGGSQRLDYILLMHSGEIGLLSVCFIVLIPPVGYVQYSKWSDNFHLVWIETIDIWINLPPILYCIRRPIEIEAGGGYSAGSAIALSLCLLSNIVEI